jgi:hypothetical protein
MRCDHARRASAVRGQASRFALDRHALAPAAQGYQPLKHTRNSRLPEPICQGFTVDIKTGLNGHLVSLLYTQSYFCDLTVKGRVAQRAHAVPARRTKGASVRGPFPSNIFFFFQTFFGLGSINNYTVTPAAQCAGCPW